MRQTIGGTWLLQLIVVFILLFVGYIILTLNYSKTIRLKNEVVNMFERSSGLTDNSIKLVNNYLTSSKYNAMGICTKNNETGIYGAANLSGNKLEKAIAKKKYYYCVKKYSGASTSKYYQVSLFYKFNLPIMGEISGFSVRGTTSNFQSADDVSTSPYCRTINEKRNFCR